MTQPTPTRSPSWGVVLFGLIPFTVGMAVLCLVVMPTLWDGLKMQFWHSTDAHIISGGIKTTFGDTTTYQAVAVYRYQVNGKQHQNNRVSLSPGPDNMGHFQQNLGRHIERVQLNHQSLPIWYDPHDPADAIINRELRWGTLVLMIVISLLFGGVGGVMLWWGFTEHDDTASEISDDQPWLQNKHWKDNDIRSNARSTVIVLFVFTLVWNLFSSPIVFLLPDIYDTDDPSELLVLLFPLVGIALVIGLVKAMKQWRRFGSTPLSLDPFPGAIGGHVGGQIKVNLPWDPAVVFKVRLTCTRTYTRTHTTGARGKHTSTSHTIEWQQDGYAQALRNDDGCTGVHFCFETPEGLPVSEPPSSNYHHWTLNVSAELPGGNLNREFNLPVYATSQTSDAQIPLSTDVFNDSLPHPSLGQLLPIVNGSKGQEIYYGYFRHPKQVLSGLITGALFSSAGLWLWSVFFLMAAILSLIGWGFVLISVYLALTSLRIRFDGKTLTSQRRILGVLVSKKHLQYQHIQSISAPTNSGKTHRVVDTKIEAVSAHVRITLAEDILSNRDKVFLQKHFEREFLAQS